MSCDVQVMREVTSFLKMLDEVYGIFGLDYTMALSTRPESYLGELTSWLARDTTVKFSSQTMD